MGPTSLKLKNLVNERKEQIAKAHAVKDYSLIPSELLYASGSGLDPHISLKAAHFQLDRVAKARHMSEAEKNAFYYQILKMSKSRLFFFLGPPCVNVLEINQALDGLKQAQ